MGSYSPGSSQPSKETQQCLLVGGGGAAHEATKQLPSLACWIILHLQSKYFPNQLCWSRSKTTSPFRGVTCSPWLTAACRVPWTRATCKFIGRGASFPLDSIPKAGSQYRPVLGLPIYPQALSCPLDHEERKFGLC